MAGGRGERFWPLSTDRLPKPFVRLMGDRTMIQMTVDRVLRLVPKERLFLVLGREHVEAAQAQLPDLPEEQLIVEPAGRDTAPCIGLAATVLSRKDPEAKMIVLPADQYIPDEDAFVRTLSTAIAWAAKGDYLVTIGIMPTRPETGYGYIRLGKAMAEEGGQSSQCFRVDRFVEKPDEATALRYLAEGGYSWNAGIFVWQARVLLKGMEAHMPDLRKGLHAIDEALAAGDSATAEARFKGLPRISIDYGLMEKADNVLVVKADFPWDDVGTWGSLRRVMPLDPSGNYLRGNPVCVDVKDCVICAEDVRLGAVGVSSLIIVASPQGVLVCDLERDQDARKVAKLMEERQEKGT